MIYLLLACGLKKRTVEHVLATPIKAMKFVGLAIGALAMSACAVSPPLVSTAPRQAALADSMVTLWPGAGALLNVVETVYVNAIEQTVSIDTDSKTPGQNYITVQYFKTNATSPTPGGLQDVPLADQDMAGEARGTVSYADMKLSPYFVQNTYGPFGYSMGRTATGDTCMYAWQRIPPPRISMSSPWKTVNVRALICASDRTEQQLLEVMLQLRLKEVAGQGRSAPGDLGGHGTIISPFGTGPANVLPVVAATPIASMNRLVAEPEMPTPFSTLGPVPAPPNAQTTPIPPPPGGSSALSGPIVPPPN